MDATTTVHLEALPDAGWRFDGWQGACSGILGCDLAMSADQNVTASFSVLPPPTAGAVRVSVSPTGSGSGRVTSSPAGIDCPGTCSTTVQSGSSLAFNEQPDASSGFGGWGGGCSGLLLLRLRRATRARAFRGRMRSSCSNTLRGRTAPSRASGASATSMELSPSPWPTRPPTPTAR